MKTNDGKRANSFKGVFLCCFAAVPFLYAILFLFFSFLFLPFAEAASEKQLRHVCEAYSVVGKKDVHFSSEEKKLICGDASYESWKKIPVNQAKFHIKTFLQQRGYFFPTFQESENKIIIFPGKKTFIKKINVEDDAPPFLNIKKLRKAKNTPLTPQKLNYIQDWVVRELKNNGYACPKVSGAAYAESGVVNLSLTPGKFFKSVKIEDQFKVFNKPVLRRFDAFGLDKPYQENLFQLTKRRTEDSGILEATYFVSQCEAPHKTDEITVEQKLILGRPRLFRFGVGANTEEYALAKIS